MNSRRPARAARGRGLTAATTCGALDLGERRLRRLPVVDDDGKLLGIISRMDIVAVFTRPDEVIEDEIREDLIRRVLFVDPDGVDVRVSQGVVTLIGEIGTHTESALLEELARRLDGVVRVDNRLSWRIEDESA